MCTLILGRDVVAPGTVLLAANRDEDPARPSDPPRVLVERPRVIGGRDRRAGGTWLAVRDDRAVVAVLNRRPDPGTPASDRRSRGALVIDVASVPASDGEGFARAALDRARRALDEAAYAPFTLVYAAADTSWMIVHDAGDTAAVRTIDPGWHVVTHADLDDPTEPRTAWLMDELRGFAPASADDAERRLVALLASHGDRARGVPPVCLHEGAMVTVSASLAWITGDGLRYRHAEGRPCEHPFTDPRPRLAPAGRLA
ncbi:MAG: NRDE family protein [Candidatus Eisenbacteria bacterium]|uniref:NRDE family protein n=1 Tax=Eiseniibacteriota bacterium TaxID=2212470 RepID=A0A9D6QN61_UNCEI|nr:NRDE family protein [Candidatus Eisenbacteria bacterium]MBI3540443.1 NRDE family protein [Candidatus Eisenbacteria bacterium]